MHVYMHVYIIGIEIRGRHYAYHVLRGRHQFVKRMRKPKEDSHFPFNTHRLRGREEHEAQLLFQKICDEEGAHAPLTSSLRHKVSTIATKRGGRALLEDGGLGFIPPFSLQSLSRGWGGRKVCVLVQELTHKPLGRSLSPLLYKERGTPQGWDRASIAYRGRASIP